MRSIVILFFTLILTIPSAFSQSAEDILGKILDTVGFDRDDLGYQPKGYWSRFPLDAPYKLTSFDDLFAEPLKLYDYSKTMANAAEIYLAPAYLDSNSDALYKLTYALGVDRKLGGFRPYSANLLEPDSLDPISSAMKSLLDDMTNPPISNFSSSYNLKKAIELENSLKNSPNLKHLIGKALFNLYDIYKWIYKAICLDRTNFEQNASMLYKIDSLMDGSNYYPSIDYYTKNIDIWSMHYAGLKSAALTEYISDSLKEYSISETIPGFVLGTPIGDIVLFNQPNHEQIEAEISSAILVIDINSNIKYSNKLIEKNIVRLIVDIGGDDIYVDEVNSGFGAGFQGIDIVYDASGNDQYIGKSFTQGAGLFGVGILFDKEGDDIYSAELMAQGAGYFGIGMLIDASGNDSFYCYGSGQGFGGHGGGVGILVDYDGDDKYVGEPSPEVYDLADYHSKGKINGNFVQGVGYGRRADMTDGHSYAGGLGAIIDISGNDHYLSGNWSLGTAYWYSTGIAYDGTGDDIYESCYFTQGSGAHFCNGILIDEGGNDKHELYETAGAGLGFGWDFANGFLINIGGNDSYSAKMISIGCAEVRSNAFLIDIGGDDTYKLKGGALGLGAVDFREYYIKPSKLHTYFYDAKSFGGFIDIGGADRYISFNDSTEIDHPRASNNMLWLKPEPSDTAYGYNNYGVGIDIETGIIPDIEKWR